MIRVFALLCASLLAGPALSNPLGEAGAQVYFLGEVHDNPAHHLVQAEAVAALAPTALVFEMLTETQAGRIGENLPDDPAALAELLQWDAAGWPDFAMYYPIFAASGRAAVYPAAVPREAARDALQTGIQRAFGSEAELYGLADPLRPEELADRLNLQMAAHCGALPLEMLPGMVDLQRMRDAVLARAALTALDETGGPVVVITGNGHARKDWGAPSFLARIRPDIAVFALGQSEDGNPPEGGFDLVLDAPGVAREDPCAVFR